MDTEKYRGQVAISYARASLGKNAGRQLDSTDRQKDEALDYADKLGLELDLNYRIVDEGISAFKLTTKIDEYGRKREVAKNLEEGALADFVEVVKKGRFPDGINLIVEKLDRLYRDKPRRALMHFLNLLENGVTIHTLIDNKIYDPDSENDAIDLMTSIMYLVASHQYSKDLSARIKLSYKRRIEKMMNDDSLIYNTGKINDWVQIKVDPDTNEKAFFVSDANKKLIQEIFELYLSNLSDQQIANKLNARGVLDFNGNAWSNHRIKDILNSRSVIGKYTPKKGIEIDRQEQLRIVSDAEWHQVQEMRKSKQAKGRKSPDGHIFNGLVTCGYCKAKQKNKRGQPYKNSTLTYVPHNFYLNRKNMPQEVVRPVRNYYCRSGKTDTRNCYCDMISYYIFHDSFFSFIKDLDFSTLLNQETKLDDKFRNNKILETKAEISELDIQINDQIRLNRLVKNETARAGIAEKIDQLSDEKEAVEAELEKLMHEKEHLDAEKQEFLNSEETIKELLEKSYNDNFWMALRQKVMDVYAKPEGTLTDAEIKEKKEISRLWDIHLDINEASKKVRDAYVDEDIKKAEEEQRKLEKEEAKLIKKYFKKEKEADEKAFEFKSALNGQLRRFIKEIKIYAFGFPLGEASAPYTDRDDKQSTFEKHYEDMIASSTKDFLSELDKLSPKKADKGWEKTEISEKTGIAYNTLRRYMSSGKVDNIVGTKKKLSTVYKQYMKAGEKVKSGAVKRKSRTDLQKYFSFSIEYTDICKPNITEYIVPHHKDRTQGISYQYNKKTKMLVQNFTFGSSNFHASKEVDGDFIRANVLMDDHVDAMSEDVVSGYISSIPRGVQEQIDEATGFYLYSGVSDDTWMIPYAWKDKELNEIIDLCKKHLMWTDKVILAQKTFHPLILEERKASKNPRMYKPLWFRC